MEQASIIEYLRANPERAELLRLALRNEEGSSKEYYLGWEWHDVRAHASTLRELVIGGIVKVTYSSRSATHYRLVNPEGVRRALAEIVAAPAEEETEIPLDLFSVIVGHGRVKDLFLDVLSADRPAHVLLVGPSASGKTMFMMELDRLPMSHFFLGGQTSKVGVADEMFEHRPRYLVIDEMDDMPLKEQSVLKSLMSDGVIARRKHGVRERDTFTTWVFAGCNKEEKVSPALRSRFMKVRFKPYTQEQFRDVVVSVLTTREGVDPEMAKYIAEKVGRHSRDPREAINISRAAPTKEKVDKHVGLLWPFGG